MSVDFRVALCACARLPIGEIGGPWNVIHTIACSALLVLFSQSALSDAPLRRVYFLESLAANLPAASRTIEAFRQRLKERNAASGIEVFVDYMDLVRYPSKLHRDNTAQYLASKYAEAPPDVLITLGRAALAYMADYRDGLAPNAPKIMVSIPLAEATAANQFGDVFWVPTVYSYVKTFELAQRLQPNAKNVALVGGASEYDKKWQEDAKRELETVILRYNVKYITGLSYSDTLKEVARLPKDTIVIMSFFFADGSGIPFLSSEVAEAVAKASPAPVYSPVSTFLGRGIVGGYMDSWEEQGAAAADLALEILSGKDLNEIPRFNNPHQAHRVDERQLKLRNLDPSRLPSDADRYFREFSIWEQYRWHIVAILFILLAQAAMITGLIVERRRRMSAEQHLRAKLMEVLHLNRSATAAALSSSVAHELNQPLAAILSYAEAAEIYLRAVPPNLEKVREILANIRYDDLRAADIIVHVRELLRKRDAMEWQEFDFKDVLRETLRMLRPEALRRGVAVNVSDVGRSLTVRADPIHLQQVLLNLAVNGLDAMLDRPEGSGQLFIETALNGGSTLEVSVADTGAGIPPDKLQAIFDAFYTTKGQGTGLGLSIARTIVETYGGKLWAENRNGGGAVFRFTLPLTVEAVPLAAEAVA